jgi:ribosomal-protein-alanine N-acetyltransferase
VLRTDRLDVRPFRESDLDGLFRMYGDEETMRYSGGSGGAHSREETAASLARLMAHQEQHGFSLYALIDRERGEFVGECGMVYVEHTGPEIEVAYYIVRDQWGQGYATEAVRACLDHGFSDLGLDRIIGVAWPDNPASLRVMEKSGMTYEGLHTYYGREMARYAAEAP